MFCQRERVKITRMLRREKGVAALVLALMLSLVLLHPAPSVGASMYGISLFAPSHSSLSVPEATAPSIRGGGGPPLLSPRAEKHRLAGSGSATVALTFDDGPDPLFTPSVLRVLQQYGVHATFFCIGEQVQLYPALVRQAAQDGNVIGNHTWSHLNLTLLPPETIRQQLSTTSAAIAQATGGAPRLVRPPDGATNATVRDIEAQLGLVEVLWTLDAEDWQHPGVAAMVDMVLTRARNGSIILMHDGGGDRSQTIQALPLIISGLEQRGFTFTTL